MKRIIVLVLLAALLLPTLFACTPSGEESKNEVSADISTDVSTDSSSTSKTPTVDELNAIYKYDIDRTDKERYLISSGKKYTCSREVYDGLPDNDGTKLTDGEYMSAGTYEGTLCSVAFVGRNAVEITLDLGEVVSEVSDFGINVVYSKAMNAALPRYISYSVSTDGENFIEIGKVYRTMTPPENSSIPFALKLQKGIDARYIKASVPKDALASIWLYFDEFCVYKYKEAEKEVVGETPEYYKSPALPEVKEDLYWSSSESDYNDVKNLILNKTYRIYAGVIIDGTVQTTYYNTPISSTLLTNGKKAPIGADYSNGEYFHFSHGRSREIIFDLDKVSAVSKLTIGYYHGAAGIEASTFVTVYGSMDGKGWDTLHEGVPTTTSTAGKVNYVAEFDATKARFVKVEFSVGSHTWIDEIEVFGKKNCENAKDIKVEDVVIKYPNEFMSADAMRGAQNLMLSYTFKCENPATGLNTKEEYLPYVAYLDTEGNIVDSFFDSFLFLPCMTLCPSGGRLYYNPDAPANKSDWLAFEEDLFYKDNNVEGLSLAVEEMDKALGTDTTMPIYFSIFSTVIDDKTFGDVDGDGKNEDFSNIDDRKKVIKWWIDRLIARYEAGEYGNLRLDGFYWYHEAIETKDPHERELLKYTADYLHSLGYLFIWIPYYQATGFADWKALGFDVACMQPNYMFHEDATINRVYDNATLSKQLGLGVEIEISGDALYKPEYLERYRAYLRVGVETGYMNSIKMYYQDGGPGVYYTACKSKDAAQRSIYDDTYLYAKGKLTLESPKVKVDTFEGNAGETLTITLDVESGMMSGCTINIAPKYGSVKEVGDAVYEYYPIEGFVGTDSFTVTIGSSINSGDATITVNIK